MNCTAPRAISFLAATLCIITNCAVATTATWVGEDASSSWGVANNWSNHTAPQSGVDSVLFQSTNHSGEPELHETFIVSAGNSMTSAGNTDGVLRIGNGGHLIVAQGATLDFATRGNYTIAEASGAMRVTFEAGASVKLHRFINGSNVDHSTEFIADQAGVTTAAVSNAIFIRGGRLDINLEQYDLNNGSDLVLFTYLHLPSQNTGFNEIQLSEGWSGEIDYHYKTETGKNAIAITNLQREGHYVDIPEPKAYTLLISGVAAMIALARRRRSHLNTTTSANQRRIVL